MRGQQISQRFRSLSLLLFITVLIVNISCPMFFWYFDDKVNEGISTTLDSSDELNAWDKYRDRFYVFFYGIGIC